MNNVQNIVSTLDIVYKPVQFNFNDRFLIILTKYLSKARSV